MSHSSQFSGCGLNVTSCCDFFSAMGYTLEPQGKVNPSSLNCLPQVFYRDGEE